MPCNLVSPGCYEAGFSLSSCLPLCACIGSSALAVEVDTSNRVFDIYYFGNGEHGQFYEDMYSNYHSAYQDFVDTDLSTYTANHWTDELKTAVAQGVSTWTNAVFNSVTEDYDRKLRIGVFLDDASHPDSKMAGANAYASFAQVYTNGELSSYSYKTYTTVEWVLKCNNPCTYGKPGGYSPMEVLYTTTTSGKTSIDVAIYINPDQIVYDTNGYPTGTQARDAESVQMLGYDVNWAVIPEPSTTTVFIFGLGSPAFRRRR